MAPYLVQLDRRPVLTMRALFHLKGQDPFTVTIAGPDPMTFWGDLINTYRQEDPTVVSICYPIARA